LDGASIYILRCADGSYYTGLTRRSVEERVSEHAQGLIADCYTFTRRPVRLIFAEYYDRIVDAIAAERRIKGWSRAKKSAETLRPSGPWRSEGREEAIETSRGRADTGASFETPA
jgi:putative endonuclease